MLFRSNDIVKAWYALADAVIAELKRIVAQMVVNYVWQKILNFAGIKDILFDDEIIMIDKNRINIEEIYNELVDNIKYKNSEVLIKNGNKILYTDYGWKTFESDDAAKINRDYVNLKDDRSIKAYKRGVDSAVAGFKEKAAKKLGK